MQKESAMATTASSKARAATRAAGDMREVSFTPDVALHAEGSCLACFGRTRVLCSATVEDGTPAFLRELNEGWVTAEYAMLPRATSSRSNRARMLTSGRTLEIQRLIGRSLRAVVDRSLFAKQQIKIDCDVLDADGGTRTAALSGACVALAIAFRRLLKAGVIDRDPLLKIVAGVSCVMRNGKMQLDPTYRQDSQADTDANFAITEEGELVEVQLTAERKPITDKDLQDMLALAKNASARITHLQREAIERAQE